MTEPAFWQSAGLELRLGDWIATQKPPIDVVAIVVAWVQVQVDDPYAGAIRYPAVAANYWWVRVPGTHFDDSDVMCGYYIDEEQREVRWDTIATLSRPN